MAQARSISGSRNCLAQGDDRLKAIDASVIYM